MAKRKETTQQRFPDLSKLSIAILENLVEKVIGESAIEEAKKPYAQKETADSLRRALAKVEADFIVQQPDPDLRTALLQLPIHDLPSVQTAIWTFYERPNDVQFSKILIERIKSIGTFSDYQIESSVTLYLKLLRRELVNVNSELREKLQTLALLDIADSLNNIENLLKSKGDISGSSFPLLLDSPREAQREGYLKPIGDFHEKIAVDYLVSLREFIDERLRESVYSLLTLAVSSTTTFPITNRFTFTFSVSPAINKDDSTGNEDKTFSSFHEAFDYCNGRVFMVGKPGAGKTTTLLAFAGYLATARLYDAKKSVPILKSIHTWRPGMNISHWLFKDVVFYGDDFINTQKFIFILDGLDELGEKVTAYKKDDSEKIEFDDNRINEEEKDKYKEISIDPRLFLLNELTRLTDGHQLVVSIRTDEFQEVKNSISLDTINLQPLSDEQIEKYFSDLKLANIWLKASLDSNLFEMFRTPLLLSLFTFAFLPVQGEPSPDIENLTENKILDLFVHRRFVHEYARFPKVAFDEITTRRFLGVLSANLLIQSEIPRVSFDVRELSRSIDTKIDATQFYSFCRTMHFFNKTNSRSTEFTHLKLRDYFAFYGLQIIARTGSLGERETSVELLGKYPRDEAIRALIDIVKNNNLTYVKIRAMYNLIGLRSIDGIRESILQLGKENNLENLKNYTIVLDTYTNVKVIPTLLKIAYTDNQFLFNWVGKTLTKYGEVAVKKLIRKLVTQSGSNKRKTIRLIGKFKNLNIAFDSVLSYLNEQEHTTRIAAIETLANFGRDSTKHLLKLLSKDEPTEIRSSAIKALAVVRDPNSIPRISKMLKDEDSQIRQFSLDALGQISSPNSVKAIGEFLNNKTTNDSEKKLALRALENHRDPLAFPFLIKCFVESGKEIRLHCASAMIFCQRPQDVPQIIMIYENENDNEVMEVLAQAIGKKSNFPYLPRFYDSLRSKKSHIRIKAVLVIQRFGDVSSQGKLRMLYENPPSPLTKEERVLLSQILADEINHFD